jgi:ABC-2 type transport system ATP-binding protein
MPKYIVELNNVTKKYPRQLALDNVSINLPGGKIIGLVGPNGSGKSTMLKLIAGLAHPTKGSVTVMGKTANRMIASDVAYLSELDVLYSFYTVAETIDYYAGLFPDFDRTKAQDMFKFMQLAPDKKVKSLSKGNRGRLKIILVLSRNAPLILMDEPLSGLDPMVRDSIIKSLISYIDLEKQTVVMTTHEIAEVEPILDTVVAIHDGHVKGMAEVEDIRSTYGRNLVDWMREQM